MNAIIIYTSKYGSTEKYAKWIGEALECPVKKLQNIKAQDLEGCDTIIYGGGVYASCIAGFKKFLKKLSFAKDKKLVLFMVGMTNPSQIDFYENAAKQNIPPEWENCFEIFALHGDVMYTKMNAVHKLVMQLPKSVALKKPISDRTEDDERLLENFGTDIMFSGRDQIEPILRYL